MWHGSRVFDLTLLSRSPNVSSCRPGAAEDKTKRSNHQARVLGAGDKTTEVALAGDAVVCGV